MTSTRTTLALLTLLLPLSAVEALAQDARRQQLQARFDQAVLAGDADGARALVAQMEALDAQRANRDHKEAVGRADAAYKLAKAIADLRTAIENGDPAAVTHALREMIENGFASLPRQKRVEFLRNLLGKDGRKNLGRLGKAEDALHAMVSLFDALEHFEKGENVQGGVKLIEALTTGAKFMPGRFGKVAGRLSGPAKALVEAAPEILALYRDPDGWRDHLPKLARKLGPDVVGQLVGQATRSELAGEAAKQVMKHTTEWLGNELDEIQMAWDDVERLDRDTGRRRIELEERFLQRLAGLGLDPAQARQAAEFLNSDRPGETSELFRRAFNDARTEPRPERRLAAVGRMERLLDAHRKVASRAGISDPNTYLAVLRDRTVDNKITDEGLANLHRQIAETRSRLSGAGGADATEQEVARTMERDLADVAGQVHAKIWGDGANLDRARKADVRLMARQLRLGGDDWVTFQDARGTSLSKPIDRILGGERIPAGYRPASEGYTAIAFENGRWVRK